MDLADVVIAIVEGFLERGDRNHVLIVPVRFMYKKVYFDAQFLFYRGSSYTTVGTREIADQTMSAEVWRQEVHHDSAWRNDGVRPAIEKWLLDFGSMLGCEQTARNPNIAANFYAPPRKVEVADVARTGWTVHVTYKR